MVRINLGSTRKELACSLSPTQARLLGLFREKNKTNGPIGLWKSLHFKIFFDWWNIKILCFCPSCRITCFEDPRHLSKDPAKHSATLSQKVVKIKTATSESFISVSSKRFFCSNSGLLPLWKLCQPLPKPLVPCCFVHVGSEQRAQQVGDGLWRTNRSGCRLRCWILVCFVSRVSPMVRNCFEEKVCWCSLEMVNCALGIEILYRSKPMLRIFYNIHSRKIDRLIFMPQPSFKRMVKSEHTFVGNKA